MLKFFRDFQGNGIIDFREFLHLMETRMKGTDTEAELREMFKVFDMDGNGFISAEEFKWTMMNLGQQLTEEEVEEIIKTADLNGDGQIDLEGNWLIFESSCNIPHVVVSISSPGLLLIPPGNSHIKRTEVLVGILAKNP